jgi:predicted DNA-binding transcriptional regulator AlpA
MMMDSKAVAEKVGVKTDSIHWYHKKGMMPPADEFFGRTPVWKEETIEAWIEKRQSRRQSPTADVPQ